MTQRRRSAFLLAAIPLAIAQAHATEITATWGAGNGNYGTASNWDIGDVPLNNASFSYIVDIGASRAITYDIANAQSIDALSLGAGSSFNLQSSNLAALSHLSVLGAATIAGAINANNATFLATGAGTTFVGNATSVSASNGGVVRIAAPSFDASGLGNQTVLSANGAGSLIDLSSVTTFSAGTTSPYNEYVTATTSARIDLSGVTKLVAPGSGSGLIFTVNSGASLDMSSLQTLDGVNSGGGATEFTLDDATATIGPLQSANRLVVNLADGSHMTIGGYAGGATLTNSTFNVSGGSVLDGNGLKGVLADAGLGNQTLLSASGKDSVINLAGLEKIDAGTTSPYNESIVATSGAKIHLSGLTSLVSPAAGSGLIFTVNSGAGLDLGALQTIGSVNSGAGFTGFSIDAGHVTLGPLLTANRLVVALADSSDMTIGGHAGGATLTNSSFSVAGGSTLNAGALKGVLLDGGLGNQTLLSATGAGSVMNLSGLTTLDASTTSPYNESVTATLGATMNLSGITALVAPAKGSGLVFTINSGASLDLSSLQTLDGATPGSGYTAFLVDDATATLGPIKSATRLGVALTSAATMTLGGYAGAATLTNSTFSVASGSKLNAGALKGVLLDGGLGNQTLLNATGNGSVMKLSGLTTLDASTTSPYNESVTATLGATMNLSGITALVAPAKGSGLVFTINSGASLDLSSLQTLDGATPGSGYTAFLVDDATATLGPIKSATRLGVALTSAATMTLGGYAGAATLTNSTFSVASGSKLNAGALKGVLLDGGLGNQTLLNATGAGSVMNLSGLTTLDASTTSPYDENVTATLGATMNLSGITALVAPAKGSGLVFTINSGASLDLSSLQTLDGATPGSGYTAFLVDDATATLGPIKSATRLGVALTDAATLTLGGYAGAATLTNSTFNVASGSTLNGGALKGVLLDGGLGNQTLLSATGTGSAMNLSGLTKLDASTTSPYNEYVTVTSNASINLSGITTLVAPASGSTLVFTVNSGGKLYLSSLSTITNPNGHVAIDVASGGGVLMHGLDAGPRVSFDLTDAGSHLTVAGSLNLLQGSTMSARNGAAVDISGNFSFQQTVESQMNLDSGMLAMDGSGFQKLEIGGKDNGLLPTGSASSGNFAIGDLDVGTTGRKTYVTLEDAVDNGNRGASATLAGVGHAVGSAEALYLNGGTGDSGLHILDGSTLNVNGLNVYFEQNGQWKSVDSLFTNGQTKIAYDQGFIVSGVPEPASWALMAGGVLAGAWRARRRATV